MSNLRRWERPLGCQEGLLVVVNLEVMKEDIRTVEDKGNCMGRELEIVGVCDN